MPGSSTGGYTAVKSWLRWLIGIVVAAVVLVVALISVVIWKMDYLMGRALTVALSQQTGARVELGEFHLHMQDSSLEIRDLKLFDPPGYRDTPWFDLPELFLAVQKNPSNTNGSVRWREIRVNLADLALVVNQKGKTNLLELGERATGSSFDPSSLTNWSSNATFGGIDRLVLSLGKLEYVDLRNSSANQEIRFGMTNRVYTNLNTVADLQPIAMEVIVRGVSGMVSKSSDGGMLQLLRQFMH